MNEMLLKTSCTTPQGFVLIGSHGQSSRHTTVWAVHVDRQTDRQNM